jgi:hypothetical protein
MLIPAVVSLLLVAPPNTLSSDPHKVFTLGMTLSQGVMLRMDSLEASTNADGAKALRNARAIAAKLDLSLPDDPVLQGDRSDTVAAIGYLMKASQHPITRQLEERHGRATAALFELGLVSHIAIAGGVPRAEDAKDLAELIETPARESGLPREQWAGLVEAYRARKPVSERIDALGAMLRTVAGSLRAKSSAAP